MLLFELLTKLLLVVGAGGIGRKTAGAVYTRLKFSYTLGTAGRGGAGGINRRGTNVLSVVIARGGVK